MLGKLREICYVTIINEVEAKDDRKGGLTVSAEKHFRVS